MRFAALSLMLLWSPLASAAGQAIVVTYGPATPAHQTLRVEHRQQETLEAIAKLMEAFFVLRPGLRFEMRECSELAAWDPTKRTLFICYDYLDHLQALLEHKDRRPVLAFTLFHEVGHALMDELRLPVTGQREDAADQFAAVWLLQESLGTAIVAAAVRYFDALAKRHTPSVWDAHGPHAQRAQTLRCLSVGAHPGTTAGLTSAPTEWSTRCREDFELARAAWNRLLEPASRVVGGRTFPQP